jgi:quercetin dioxygenase-like cupin family protein
MTIRFSRTNALSALVGGAALVWIAAQPFQQTASAQAQPPGQGQAQGRGQGQGRGTQSLFMGGTPRNEDAAAVRTSRLLFPAGVRSNWHSHSWGQLLMVERGKGLTQERGGPVKEMLPYAPFFTKAGVEHWHGAAPDQDMLQLTIYEGDVKWLEPVQDKEYRAVPQR